MQDTQRRTVRLLCIAILFAVGCLVFLGNLLYIEIIGLPDESKTTTRTVCIQAVRGAIYDRNGKLLVSNQNVYDLSLSYADFSTSGNLEKNRTLLALQEAFYLCGEDAAHDEEYFPYEGQYPYYNLSDEAQDNNSAIYYRYKRVLGDLGLKETATPDEVLNHYVKTYDLLKKNSAGNRFFSDDEIDILVRIYYDMDALRFASNGEYLYGKDISKNLLTYVQELGLSGVAPKITTQRVYHYPGYASHILGTVGPIYSEEWDYYNELGYEMNATVGKSGCEAAFESYLHGSDGLLIIEEDANGNVVSTRMKKEPVAGSDIRLTIDIDLQIAAEDGLKENVEYVSKDATTEETGAACNAGATVVMDPNTFDVLAIASYPTFDLETYNLDYTDLAENEAKPLLNRALSGTYAPGSTFKPGVALAALTEGELTQSEKITCTGRYKSTVGCSTYGVGTGKNHTGAIDVKEAIAFSCNTFFCEMGDRLGIARLHSYMTQYGFGQSTGIELAENTGVAAGPEYRAQIHGDLWQIGDVWNAAIGQSDTQVTPLQLAAYASMLGNGGTRYQAHLLYGVYPFGSNEPSYKFTQTEDTVLSQITFAEDDLTTVHEGMKMVVENSTVIRKWINSNTVPVTVGAKTGTAQTGRASDNALFICMAPYDNPEIAVSVVLENGVSGGNASLTAGRILQTYYENKKAVG